MSTSDRKAEANRRNAQKSTGPKTPEGKERSRRNGLKHGLAAKVVLPEADQAAIEKETQVLMEEILPEGQVETELVEQTAAAAVRIRMCQRIETETQLDVKRTAVTDWEHRKRNAIRAKASRLKEDPAELVEELERTAFGCDWLINRWNDLRRPLEANGEWTVENLRQATRLKGLPVTPQYQKADTWIRLQTLATRLDEAAKDQERQKSSETDIKIAPTVCSENAGCSDDTGDTAAPTAVEAARADLMDYIDAEIERLGELCDAHWAEIDQVEFEAVQTRALVDTSKEAQVRHRYERAAFSVYHRSLDKLIKLKDRKIREDYKALQGSVPKSAVGGGWWKEDRAAPAPEGCVTELMMREQVARARRETRAQVEAELRSRLEAEYAAAAHAGVAHGEQSEATAGVSSAVDVHPKTFASADLRSEAAPTSEAGPPRTRPLPTAPRPPDGTDRPPEHPA